MTSDTIRSESGLFYMTDWIIPGTARGTSLKMQITAASAQALTRKHKHNIKQYCLLPLSDASSFPFPDQQPNRVKIAAYFRCTFRYKRRHQIWVTFKSRCSKKLKNGYRPQVGIGHQDLQSKCSQRQTRSSAATSNRLSVLFVYKRGLDSDAHQLNNTLCLS